MSCPNPDRISALSDGYRLAFFLGKEGENHMLVILRPDGTPARVGAESPTAGIHPKEAHERIMAAVERDRARCAQREDP